MKKLITIIALFAILIPIWSQNELPLKEVAIFSSGVAYYEHSGKVNGTQTFDFAFSREQVSDVLKSISVYDAAAKKILLKYDSSDTLHKTLESLSININSEFSLKELLFNEKGSEIQIFTTEKIIGKILSVENFSYTKKSNSENQIAISLLTSDGIKIIKLEDIKKFEFLDSKKNEDLKRALELISKTSGKKQKKLQLELIGNTDRNIKVAYVMDSAVWKTSYRLELGEKEAIFQAWAIVDNSTNFDWKNVNLKLITGKPISFKQNLFAPYYIQRQELPLSVEGSAEVAIYDSDLEAAYEESAYVERTPLLMEKNSSKSVSGSSLLDSNQSFSASTNSISSERFVFEPSEPISLERQKSIMIPLKVATIPTKKISVFSNIPQKKSINPKLCIELKNTTGFKLPAGPITIFDNGYAGDALIEFLPENETRLIAYGDDLLLRASNTKKNTSNIETIKINNGIMKIESSLINKTVYTIKNSHTTAREVLIEHPINRNFDLYKTDKPSETTAKFYRFKKQIPAKDSLDYEINEKKNISSNYTISNFSERQIFQYTTNMEIPTKVRKIFRNILDEIKKVEAIKKELSKLKQEKQDLYKEQDRARKNMEALSNSTHSEKFLNKLLTIETQLEKISEKTKKSQDKLTEAEKKYEEFIKNINY